MVNPEIDPIHEVAEEVVSTRRSMDAVDQLSPAVIDPAGVVLGVFMGAKSQESTSDPKEGV